MRYVALAIGILVSNSSHSMPRCYDMVTDVDDRHPVINCDIYKEDFDYNQHDDPMQKIIRMIKEDAGPSSWYVMRDDQIDYTFIQIDVNEDKSIVSIDCCEHIFKSNKIPDQLTYSDYFYRKFDDLFKMVNANFF